MRCLIKNCYKIQYHFLNLRFTYNQTFCLVSISTPIQYIDNIIMITVIKPIKIECEMLSTPITLYKKQVQAEQP